MRPRQQVRVQRLERWCQGLVPQRCALSATRTCVLSYTSVTLLSFAVWALLAWIDRISKFEPDLLSQIDLMLDTPLLFDVFLSIQCPRDVHSFWMTPIFTRPVLLILNMAKPFKIKADASFYATGAFFIKVIQIENNTMLLIFQNLCHHLSTIKFMIKNFLLSFELFKNGNITSRAHLL